MLVLPCAQELQLVGQAQVQPDLLELDVRLDEHAAVGPDFARANEQLVKVQRRVVQAQARTKRWLLGNLSVCGMSQATKS